MTLELGLLILESVLLLATVMLLAFSIKEGRGRKELLLEVSRATRILTRHEYFTTVLDSMTGAKGEVVGFVTGRFPSGEDRKMTLEIGEKVQRLAASGVKVRYLLPKFHDRLHVGALYRRAGAEVRFSGRRLVHDIRYTIIDGKDVVLGIPELTGEKEATKKGYRIPSEGLSAVLKEHFYGCWEGGSSFEEFVREVIKQTGTTPKLLAEELQIDEAEISGLAQ